VSELNIFQRINAVREDVKYIQKDAKVQGYSAVTHDMVTASLRASLVKHGIVIVPRQTSGRVIEPRDPANGVKMLKYQGDYEIDFVNMDKPDEKVTMPIQAHADDNGDKAPGKCLSYATKSAMLKLFSLETGENDESRVADEDLSDITEALNACEDMDALQATFKLAWASYPNSRKELTAIKDAKKKELASD